MFLVVLTTTVTWFESCQFLASVHDLWCVHHLCSLVPVIVVSSTADVRNLGFTKSGGLDDVREVYRVDLALFGLHASDDTFTEALAEFAWLESPINPARCPT